MMVVRGKQDLKIEGPRLNHTKEDKMTVRRGLDQRLSPIITPLMPLMEVSIPGALEAFGAELLVQGLTEESPRGAELVSVVPGSSKLSSSRCSFMESVAEASPTSASHQASGLLPLRPAPPQTPDQSQHTSDIRVAAINLNADSESRPMWTRVQAHIALDFSCMHPDGVFCSFAYFALLVYLISLWSSWL